MKSKIFLGLLRVWLGWQWLSAGWSKVTSDVWTGKNAGVAITGFLKGSIAKSSGAHPEVHGWYAGFIENIALPNTKFFSYLVAYGEVVTGIALIIGSFTLFAVLGSIFMNLNYLFAGTSSSNPEMLLVGILILIFFGKASFYGVDYYLNPLLFKNYNRFNNFLKEKKFPLQLPRIEKNDF